MNASEARRLLKKAGFYIARNLAQFEVWSNGKEDIRMGRSTTIAPAEISKIRSVLRKAETGREKAFSPRQAVKGVRVRSIVDFYEVPKGSTGTIDELYDTGFFVKWDLPKSIRDGFDARTELRFLERIP